MSSGNWCKKARARLAQNDMNSLRAHLLPPRSAVLLLVATGMVFYFGLGHSALLLLLGLLLGATMFYAGFGFTGAYRRLMVYRDGKSVMPQFLLLGLSSALFAPILAGGGMFGQTVVGAAAPVSMSVAIGAFMFGIRMQLAGGCGSGTLYALGRGSAPMLDANTGQNALSQVKAFDQALGVTGLILTKLDGTAKSGVIAAIAKAHPIPVRFIGVGEGLDDLQPFVAEDFVAALLELEE